MVGLGRSSAASAKEQAAQSDELAELIQLARAAGADVVGRFSQRRNKPDPAWFLGRGKAEALRELIAEREADLAIFDEELSPSQTRNLEGLLSAQVVDRTGLILDIFARRAETREGKLQVELAQLSYLVSRLTGRGEWLSRLGGGIGTRGPGETQLEVDRRRIRTRMARLRREIEQIRRHRKLHRTQRARSHLPSVSLVGYTNAGKSTLFARLSGQETHVSGQVFSTLDTRVRRVQCAPGRAVLLSDTVGFVRKLPTQLVAAFRATLEEVAESDLILHVVDVSDPEWESKVRVVEGVLADIGCAGHPQLRVLNKADRVDGVSPETGIPVSALTGQGMARLREVLLSRLREGGHHFGDVATG